MSYRILLLLFVLLVGGCSTVPKTEKAVEKMPLSTIRVGSLDISSVTGRLERKAIDSLAGMLKKEGVEVVAVQGITRYPGVRTRVDFVDELARRAEMRQAFGEVMNYSGRQTGNAVLSIYPILSSQNQPIDVPASSEFAAALHAVIDGGIVEISVVSVKLPRKGSAAEQSRRVKTIAAAEVQDAPVILAGNLPSSDEVSAAGGFERTTRNLKDLDQETLWYGTGERLRPLNGRLIKTGFGTMTLVEFELMRKDVSSPPGS